MGQQHYDDNFEVCEKCGQIVHYPLTAVVDVWAGTSSGQIFVCKMCRSVAKLAGGVRT